MPLTARRAVSFVPSAEAKSIALRSHSEARNRFGISVQALGRALQAPQVVMYSCSSLPSTFGGAPRGSIRCALCGRNEECE